MCRVQISMTSMSVSAYVRFIYVHPISDSIEKSKGFLFIERDSQIIFGMLIFLHMNNVEMLRKF